jgi:hypothetical protein
VRRIFWVALGATAGVLIVRRITQMARAVTPAAVADNLSEAGDRARSGLSEFFETVGEYAAEREHDLRTALGLEPDGTGAD